MADDKVQQAKELVEQHGSIREAARRSNIPYTTLRERYSESGAQNGDTTSQPANQFQVTDQGNEKTIWSVGDAVRTVDEALEKAEVDTSVWEIKEPIVNSWPTSMKDKDGNPKTVWNWQVKVKLQRKIPYASERSCEEFYKRLEKYAPKYPKIRHPKKLKNPHMLELCLFDAHFGKLAWRMETGQDYDLKIAEHVYLNAVKDLLDKASPYNIEKIVLPIGSDFMDSDNQQGETPKNQNKLDTDSRLFKVYHSAVVAVQKAIEYCRAVAPVEVVWIPGNHDPNTSWYMAREIAAIFTHANDVDVDYTPTSRKIITYGENGIMLAHGDEEAHRDLPIIQAAEDREAWGRTKYNEVHCGHLHKKKQVSFAGADTYGGGVVVRVISSLSSADLWLYRKGLHLTEKAAEAYLWGESPGLEAMFNASARRE